MEMSGKERGEQKSLPIDRLSELPDEILCHILSFLKTKTSAATSILARRWRFLWAYVPNLDFFGHMYLNHRIIDTVLKRHKLPSLKSFTLDLLEDYDENQVEAWIIAAIERNVEYLHLYVSYHNLLPCRLFTCETLVDLSLDRCGKIPTLECVCLPCLKKLWLQNVEFEDDKSLPCLLSGCPVLNYLDIKSNTEVMDVCSLTPCYISSPTLKCLYLMTVVYHSNNGPRGYRLEINTPALEYLRVRDYLSDPIESGDLASLIEADISHVGSYFAEDEILCCGSMLKFVDSLSNVKCLRLDLCDYKKIVDSLLSAWIPRFDNLIKLELIADSRFLSKFLENANNLEILEFRKHTYYMEHKYQFHEPSKGWLEPHQVPKCLLSCLRTTKIGNIVCTEDGLKIVRYLLRNAKVLKMMDITYPRGFDSEKKNSLFQKISLFEQGSKACELAYTEAKPDPYPFL